MKDKLYINIIKKIIGLELEIKEIKEKQNQIIQKLNSINKNVIFLIDLLLNNK